VTAPIENTAMRDRRTDVLIVGGGLGGVAAALGTLRLGKNVILTEETDWIGGQLTAQAVPPDEHPWIEGTGYTATYQRLRRSIRDYYRSNYPLLPDARFDTHLNPGQGRVSRLCHEPRAALTAMYQLLAPYLVNRQIEILLRSRAAAVESAGDSIRAVCLRDMDAGDEIVVVAPYILDATELGDLLPLAGVSWARGMGWPSRSTFEKAAGSKVKPPSWSSTSAWRLAAVSRVPSRSSTASASGAIASISIRPRGSGPTLTSAAGRFRYR